MFSDFNYDELSYSIASLESLLGFMGVNKPLASHFHSERIRGQKSQKSLKGTSNREEFQ
jgi:hypothetical protein